MSLYLIDMRSMQKILDPVLLSLIHGNKISLVYSAIQLQTAILDVYHTFNYGVNNSVIRRSSLSNSM